MKIKAYPKINLCLDVVSRREDGYHELNSVFCLCDVFQMRTQLYDTLDIELSDVPGIRIRIPGSDLTNGPDNLVWKAARIMLEESGSKSGVDVNLEKRIPSGAGLGGGSSDAAAVLKELNRALSLDLDDEELIKKAAVIGADVPFFIKGGTAHVTGTGEKIKKIKNVPRSALMIIKPLLSVSTAEAYRAVDESPFYGHPDTDAVARAIKDGDYKAICSHAGNSFEDVVFKKYPQIRKIKEAVLNCGADCAVMTGSGSAIYALFENTDRSQEAAVMLRKNKDLTELIGGMYV